MPTKKTPTLLTLAEILLLLSSCLIETQLLQNSSKRKHGPGRKKAGQRAKGHSASKEKIYGFERILSEDGTELGVKFYVPR